MKRQYFKVWQPVYEGEGGESGEGGTTTETPPASAKPPAESTPPAPVAEVGGVKFNEAQQKAMNSILAQEKRKAQDAVNKAIAEAQAASKKAQLTAKERQELESRLGQLQDELLTKEQLAKKNAERQKKTYEEQIHGLSSERDDWRNRYTQSTIQRSITDAAAHNNAFSPKQIVAILGGDTRLVEVLDSQGKPTGSLEPKVRFRDVDKEGKPVILDLAPKDAVKRMKEMDEYLNLFKGEGTGGAGLRSQPGGRKPGVRDLAKDPAAYRAARKRGEVSF